MRRTKTARSRRLERSKPAVRKKSSNSGSKTTRVTHARSASVGKKKAAQGFIVDLETGKILKSFAIVQPALLPARKKSSGTIKHANGVQASGQHVTRAATIKEARAQLGMSKEDVERAQQLLLTLDL
jgi:hypothetical protein